ncbi:MAG: hypothetical protein ACK5MK_10035 [Dysgonomonas sp.]
MKPYSHYYTILFFSIIFLLSSSTTKTNREDVLFRGTAKQIPDSAILPDVPLWTKYGKMFMYAPAFDFDSVKEAVEYKYKLSSASGKVFSFRAKAPNLLLSPVWEKIPEGRVVLHVIALNKFGDSIALAGSKNFYRSIPFQGITNSPKRPYKSAAYLTLDYIFNLPHIQKWVNSTRPDLDYIFYAYPAKIISAAIEGMLLYSENSRTNKADSLKAMTIALNMAHHLTSISTSKHPLLRYFAPTYDVEFYNERVKDTVQYPPVEHISHVYKVMKKDSHKMMLLYGYEYAYMLLNLYDRTKDAKWLHIVKSIAESYKQLQLSDGSWYLNIDYQTAEPLSANKLIPGNLLMFYKKIEKEYGIVGYQDVIDKAEKWIRRNPLKTFDWEGQFEDIASYDEPYRNLTKYTPTDYAIYLLRYESSKENIAIAKELIRFSEDQFVTWGKTEVGYHTPGVMEQYSYFAVIDASACQMIKAYLEVYKVTKEKEYYRKAETLANSITEQQQENGEIYTVWKEDPNRQNWLNCMVYSANTLMFLDKKK